MKKHYLKCKKTLLLVALFGALSYFYLQTYTIIDYSKLESLLQAKKWMEADDETSNIIGKSIARSVDRDNFTGYALIDNISLREYSGRLLSTRGIDCSTLQKVDALWRKYSGDNFGFTIQSQISKTLKDKRQDGNTIMFDEHSEFSERVGWNYLDKTRHKDASLYFRTRAWYTPATVPSQHKGFLPSLKWLTENNSKARYDYWLAIHHFDLCSKNR